MKKTDIPVENWLFNIANSCVLFEQLDVVNQLALNALTRARVIDAMTYHAILCYTKSIGYKLYNEELADLQ